ncbi:hypothetical protein O3M35_009607 [Rhynocoris fuscipes]|uniref:Rab32 n=1 Tax=Rhynocoris fuscipes TaxID=488301 RepID=A0AAW1D5W1_9HEMI
MSEQSSTGKLKTFKKSSKKKTNKLSSDHGKTESIKKSSPDSASVSDSVSSTATCKSPKSLIKKLNISKVYKSSKKKSEEKEEKVNIDLTESQETLCSMDEENITTTSMEKQEQNVQQQDNIDDGKQQEDTVTLKAESITQSDETTSSSSPTITNDDIENNKLKEENITTTAKDDDGNKKKIIANDDFIKNEQNDDIEATGALKKECLYKILVIGELGTGKTSIIKRYVHQFFSQHYRATIGVDFALKVINWDPNTIIRLQLWDIAGKFFFIF